MWGTEGLLPEMDILWCSYGSYKFLAIAFFRESLVLSFFCVVRILSGVGKNRDGRRAKFACSFGNKQLLSPRGLGPSISHFSSRSRPKVIFCRPGM